MLASDTRLRVAGGDVAAQVMDGEAIIINLANGLYYSMGGVGGELWEMIQSGRSVGEITEAVSGRYRVERERVAEDLEGLARQLLDEGLVIVDGEGAGTGEEAPASAAPGSTASADDTAAPPRGSAGEPTGAYEPPVLHIYRDMADLLALDPPMPGLATPPTDEADAGS